MLSEVEIENFKAIGKPVRCQLQPFTVLIGRNGSGKSSLIDSIDWLGHALHDGADAATAPFQRIGDLINSWRPRSHRALKIQLTYLPDDISIGEKVHYVLEVGADQTGVTPLVQLEELRTHFGEEFIDSIITNNGIRQRKLTVESRSRLGPKIKPTKKRRSAATSTQQARWPRTTDPDRLALAEADLNEDYAGYRLKEFLRHAIFLRLNPRAIASFSSARRNVSPRIIDDEGRGLAYLLGQLEQETLEILVDKLSYALNTTQGIGWHAPTGPGDQRYFTISEETQRGGEIKIPAWVLSEGLRRVTTILAALLFEPAPSMVCVEELENGLDPWTIQFVLEELIGASLRGTQVIVTTHSPHLLNFVPPENVIFVEKTNKVVTMRPVAKLRGLEEVWQRMACGELYSNRYFNLK